MNLNNFPKHVLNRAEAAAEMAFEEGGDVAEEMAFHAVLERWVQEQQANCEEHDFEDCRICKLGFTPRTDHPYGRKEGNK